MTLSWRDCPKGIPKTERYSFIRKAREEFLNQEISQLIIQGAKVIPDYPAYLIMFNGDIYSTLNTKLTKLKSGRKESGYRFVGLTDKDKNRKYEMVHRLVAKAFIPCDDFSLEVNHKDGNKSNNSVENLEWVTAKQNNHHLIHVLKRHRRSQKLNCSDVNAIFFAEGKYRDIGKQFGVSAQTVCNIKRKSMYRRELEELGLL